MRIPLESPAKYQSAYEHGLIYYKMAQNATDFPPSFFESDVFLEIIDHPISAIDSKRSVSLVKWKHSECGNAKSAAKGKSVFHKVIPFCNEDFVQNTIQGKAHMFYT